MKNTLAIDLGGTNTKFAIVTKDFKILEEKSFPTEGEKGAKAACERWLTLTSDWLKKHEVDLVGIGSPGPLDSDTGKILFSPNLKNWADFSFTEFFKTRLSVPAFLENDANCAALGEWSDAREIEDHVILTLGTGVGSGVISGGNLIRGVKGLAVEAGHMTIDRKGPLCECGKRGCLETFVGGFALVRNYNLLLKTKGQLDFAKSPLDIFKRAESGEKLAQEMTQDWAQALAVGVGNLINIFNPSRVTLTGGVSLAFPFVEADFQKNLLTNAFDISIKYSKAVVSKLQNKAGLLGAAIWAQKNYERKDLCQL